MLTKLFCQCFLKIMLPMEVPFLSWPMRTHKMSQVSDLVKIYIFLLSMHHIECPNILYPHSTFKLHVYEKASSVRKSKIAQPRKQARFQSICSTDNKKQKHPISCTSKLHDVICDFWRLSRWDVYWYNTSRLLHNFTYKTISIQSRLLDCCNWKNNSSTICIALSI